jgi:hypothetical protein
MQHDRHVPLALKIDGTSLLSLFPSFSNYFVLVKIPYHRIQDQQSRDVMRMFVMRMYGDSHNAMMLDSIAEYRAR